MREIKTIAFAIPVETAREIQKLADEESLTVPELFQEFIRQKRAQRTFESLSKKLSTEAKKKGIKPEDFCGPFED